MSRGFTHNPYLIKQSGRIKIAIQSLVVISS